MPQGVVVVVTRCTDPKRDEEYNRWYTHAHLPDMSKARGFVRARRFRNLDPNGPGQYMALYEFDSPDLKESAKDLSRLGLEAFKAGRHIDCIIGVQSQAAGVWQEIDPEEYRPLERLDYPRTPPEALRKSIEASLKR